MHFWMNFRTVLNSCSKHFSLFFVLRANGRDTKNAIPSTRKPVFSRCALAPLPRGRRRKTAHKMFGNSMKKERNNYKNSDIFRVGRPCSKNAAKTISRRPSGSLPGTPREVEIDQLFAPSRPPGRQQEFLGRPGAAQSRSRRPPGRLWKQVLRPGGAERPAGSDFGAMLASFLAPF